DLKKKFEEIEKNSNELKNKIYDIKEKIKLAELRDTKIKYENRLEEINKLLTQKPNEKILEEKEDFYKKILELI
ncbi:MAG: hypothetical protein ACK4ON_05935, partial [Bacteroidia bacterium]